MSRRINRLALSSIAALTAACFFIATSDGQTVGNDLLEHYVAEMFGSAAPEWQARVTQDETQRICSQHRNNPPAIQAGKILEREKATLVFPQDGSLMGDWKAGEEVAQNGRGGQFTDEPNTVNGGNCYACHQLAPGEVSYGTLGPSLLGYGKIHGSGKEAAREVYTRIFNPQAVTACSQMPRFGYHSFLTMKQIKDVVAYLLDPQSPVNR